MAGVGAGKQVLLDREMLEAVPPLHDLDDTLPDQIRGGQRVDALALVEDRSLGHFTPFGAQQVGDGLQGRGLAGAVGAEEGDDAPLRQLEGDALQHENDVVVDHLDIVHVEVA